MGFEAVYGEPFIITCRVQHVSVAKKDEGREFSRNNYCLTALIPKEDDQTLEALSTAICEAGQCSDWDQLKKHPLLDGDGNWRDGDDPAVKDQAKRGCWFFTCGSSNKPQTFTIIDTPNGDVVECAPEEIYAGAYCALLLTPSQYRAGEVTFYLNAVTLVRHGQRLASRIDPMQAFRNFVQPMTAQVEEEAPVKRGGGPLKGKKAAAPVEAPEAPEEPEQTEETEAEPPRRKRGRPPGGGPAASAPAAKSGGGPKVANGRGNNLSNLMSRS